MPALSLLRTAPNSWPNACSTWGHGMRKSLGSIGLGAVIFAELSAGTARAACECPKSTLDERIAGSVMIFAGKPLLFAQIPEGASPFHSEQSMEAPGVVKNDTITLFQIDTVWKGGATHRIKIRNDHSACGADFKLDVPVVVFAEADPSGVLWTRPCSGNAAQGDAGYEALKQDLTNRLRFN
jgi:hypothetical protein